MKKLKTLLPTGIMFVFVVLMVVATLCYDCFVFDGTRSYCNPPIWMVTVIVESICAVLLLFDFVTLCSEKLSQKLSILSKVIVPTISFIVCVFGVTIGLLFYFDRFGPVYADYYEWVIQSIIYGSVSFSALIVYLLTVVFDPNLKILHTISAVVVRVYHVVSDFVVRKYHEISDNKVKTPRKKERAKKTKPKKNSSSDVSDLIA